MALCGPASALTTISGAPFTVQVTVTASCAINTGPSGTIDFGSNAGTGPAPGDIGSSVGVTCTNGSAYNIRFTSTNAVTANTNRIMVNGAENIGYQIRKTSNSALIGDNTATSLAGTGTGVLQTTAINFHINNWTPVTPALYTDSVTLQVDF